MYTSSSSSRVVQKWGRRRGARGPHVCHLITTWANPARAPAKETAGSLGAGSRRRRAVGEPAGEGVQRAGVGAVVALREAHEVGPGEVRVLPRRGAGRRAHHPVLARAQEEGQRLPLLPPVHHRAVQAALVPPVGQRHEGVADVDDHGAWDGPDGAPLAVHQDLQPADVVLQEDGQRRGVAVRARAQRALRHRARRVVVAPHDGAAVLEELPVVAALHAQAQLQQLHDRQRQLLHLLAVPLVHPPHWLEILAEGAGEVVHDDGRRGAVVEAEGQGLLPGELGREPVGVRARVPGHGAGDAPGPLLLSQRQPEEVAGAVQRGAPQRRVHAVPAHLEEPVRRARRRHLRRGAAEPRAVAIAQHAHVHHRHLQLRGRGRPRLFVRPQEWLRDLGLPAQVEHSRGLVSRRVGPVLASGEVNAGSWGAEGERWGRAGVHGCGCALLLGRAGSCRS
uniref:Uncharacterized protein n=1 Tax=Zea mays TaxID=4577 RepID=C0PKG6_MAIZE|nr:unknown [Zea mays]